VTTSSKWSPMAESVHRAVLWSGLEQAGGYCMRCILPILLARLLTPADYGLMRMLLVFWLIAQVFVDCELRACLIQRKEICLDDEAFVSRLAASHNRNLP